MKTGRPRVKVLDPQSQSGKWFHDSSILAISSWISSAFQEGRGLVINVTGAERSGKSQLLAVTACELQRRFPEATVQAGRYLDSGKFSEWDLGKLDASDGLAAGKTITGIIGPISGMFGVPLVPQVNSLIGQLAQAASDWRAASKKLKSPPKIVPDLRDKIGKSLGASASIFVVDDLDAGSSRAFSEMLLDSFDSYAASGPTVVIYSTNETNTLRPRVSVAPYKKLKLPMASRDAIGQWLSPCSDDLARSLSGACNQSLADVTALFGLLQAQKLTYNDSTGRTHVIPPQDFSTSVALRLGMSASAAQIEAFSRKVYQQTLDALKSRFSEDDFTLAVIVLQAAAIEGFRFAIGPLRSFTGIHTKSLLRIVTSLVDAQIFRVAEGDEYSSPTIASSMEFDNAWRFRVLRQRSKIDDDDQRKYADAILQSTGRKSTATLISLRRLALALNDASLQDRAEFAFSRNASDAESDLDKTYVLELVRRSRLPPAHVGNLANAAHLLDLIHKRPKSQMDAVLAKESFHIAERWEDATLEQSLTTPHAAYHALFKLHDDHYDTDSDITAYLCQYFSKNGFLRLADPLLRKAVSGLAAAEASMHNHEWAAALAYKGFSANAHYAEPSRLSMAALDLYSHIGVEDSSGDDWFRVPALRLAAGIGLADAHSRIVAAWSLRRLCDAGESFDGFGGWKLAQAAAFIAFESSERSESLVEFLVTLLKFWPRPIVNDEQFAAVICVIPLYNKIYSQDEFRSDVRNFALEVLGTDWSNTLDINCPTTHGGEPHFGYQNIARVVRGAFDFDDDEIEALWQSAVLSLGGLPQAWKHSTSAKKAIELDVRLQRYFADRFAKTECTQSHAGHHHVVQKGSNFH